MTRSNAEFFHPLYEGGDQPMYRWMHQGEWDEAQSNGAFKPGRNVAPIPQDQYNESPSHILVRFTSPPGRWRKKDLEGYQSKFYINSSPIPFDHGEIVKRNTK